MKVSLLTVFIAAALPDALLAQQPVSLRQGAQPVRIQQVQQNEKNSFASKQQGDARVEPEYRFTVAISITATGYEKGQKRENSVTTYYINPGQQWVATPSSACGQRVIKANGCSGLEIYDVPAGRMLVLNTREKSGVALSIPTIASADADRRKELKLPPPGENGCKCEKTGKKKKIEGFNAEEWSCTSPNRNTRFDMWLTKDLKTDLAAPGAHTELRGFMYRAARFQAIPLEGYYYVNGELMSSLMLTGVNRATKLVVNTSEYELNKGRN